MTRPETYSDGVDAVVAAAEARWGIGRLRLLVSDATRAKFDQADAMWQGAIAAARNGDPTDKPLPALADMMRRAWAAIAAEAEAAGAQPIAPEAWEGDLPGGGIVAICRSHADASAYALRCKAEGRRVSVWTMDAVAEALSHHLIANACLAEFPGAKVRTARVTSDAAAFDSVFFSPLTAADEAGDDYTAPGPKRPGRARKPA